MDGVSPDDRDLMVRTVLGEAGGEPPVGQFAVANVILNRLASGKYGRTASDVVLAPNQFEPWQARASELQAVDPRSPAYQRTAKVVDDAMSGGFDDPTGGATHFFAPKAQAALGRQAPSWGRGQPLAQFGGHAFFAPNGPVARGPAQDAISTATGGVAKAQATATKGPGNMSDDELDALILGKPAAGVAGGQSAAAASSLPVAAQGLQAGSAPAPAGGSADLSDGDLDALILGKGAASQPGRAQAAQAPQQPESALAGTRAALTGYVEGLPIIGPTAVDLAQRGGAALRAVTDDVKYSDALRAIKDRSTAENAAHPTAFGAGSIGGGVAGTILLAGAAPEAFGINSGVGLARNMMAAGVTGGALGAADTAVRAGGDPGAIAMGGGVGAAFGLAGPAAGKAIGSGVNRLISASQGVTPAARNANKLFDAAGMSHADVGDALARLGPSATIADVNPAFLTDAAALAARGGESTSIVKTAMQARAAGADSRVSQAIDTALGPKPDLNAALEMGLSRARQQAAPHYQAAQANAQPMDVTHILGDIDGRLKTAVGGEANVLKTIKGYLTEQSVNVPGVGEMAVPKSDPASLLKARQGLDDLIQRLPQAETSAGRNATATAHDLRGQIDDVLKRDPNIAAGDAAYSGEMKLRSAMQDGADVFKRGVRPEDFSKTFQALSPAEQDAFRAGARTAIGDAMEQASRGELAGAQQMFGKNSANRQKLDALFPKGGDALDALHGEATMRATEQRLLRQSATAENTAAMQRYGVQPQGGLSNDLLAAAQGMAMGDPTGGIATAMARRGIANRMAGFRTRAMDSLSSDTARGFVATGSEQQAFLETIARQAELARRRSPTIANGTNLLLQAASPEARNRLINP